MGLFGALFAGVSGLGSQSNKIGIVSNNISNVNTVGYKQGSAAFNTLVVPGASTGAFSPGGVLGNNRQLVAQQGLIQATTSVTDVAISGNGLFVVNTKSDGTGDTIYTRAGSFAPDANGNFKNAAGFYLQGIQVTDPQPSPNARLLTTVNVNQNATGSSVATSAITLAANFNAAQTPFAGAGEVATFGTNSAKQILVPNSTNGLVRGDTFSVKVDGGANIDFVYGGFMQGRDVTSTSTLGDGGFALTNETITTGISSFGTGATDSATTSAINGIDVTSKTVDAVTNGPFTAGTLTIDGVGVAVAAGQSLNTIASNIATALGGGSTATVVGSPGNYSIVIRDANTAAGVGVDPSSSALTSTATYTLSGPYAINDENEISLTVTDASLYTVGKTAFIDGVTGSFGGLAASTINGKQLTIVNINTSTNVVTLRLPTPTTVAGAASGEGGSAITISNRTYGFTGNMLDATNDTDDFLQDSGVSNFTTTSLSFTIDVAGTSHVFTYNGAPNTTNGQFNSLSTLVTAINAHSGGDLTASLVGHQLYIGASDSSLAVHFSNGDSAGASTGTPPLAGIDWIQELGLKDVAAAGTGVNRFDTLQSLADAVNAVSPSGVIEATVSNPTGIASVSINAVSPLSTIEFFDSTTNQGESIINALGFKSSINGNLSTSTTNAGGKQSFDTGVFGKTYDPNVTSKNMSSGAVAAQFSKDITIYDAQGNAHTISMNVLKLSTNTWALEFTAVPASDVTSTNNDGLITAGTVTFRGDGTLGSADPIFDTAIAFKWTNGADQSQIKLSLGEPNTADGLTQFAGASNVSQAVQNGSPTGQLTGVGIDENGFVTATFSNGQTQKLYQIPLAAVNNYNGLSAISGNAYKQTLASGEVSLSYAGFNGTGTLAASALEQSNVDLSTQLTDLIVAQQAYGANTRVLTVTSQLLQQLNQIIQ